MKLIEQFWLKVYEVIHLICRHWGQQIVDPPKKDE